MSSNSFSRDEWLIIIVALLLAFDLLFLPWFQITVGPITVTATATSAPNGWYAGLAVLCAVALVIDLGIDRLAPQLQLPAIADSRDETRFALAAAAAVFVALKFAFNVSFSSFAFGFYAAVILAAALVYLTMQQRGGLAL